MIIFDTADPPENFYSTCMLIVVSRRVWRMNLLTTIKSYDKITIVQHSLSLLKMGTVTL